MEALDLVRRRQIEGSEHPKIYIPGTIHYVYKVSRAVPKLVIVSTTNSPTNVTDERDLSNCHGSSNRFINVEKAHYVMETSKRSIFSTMQLKNNLLVCSYSLNLTSGAPLS